MNSPLIASLPLWQILIVDDSFLMRRVIRSIIERDARLQVTGEATDGLDALQKAAALRPDLILLDIEMPRMDGLEFLRHARLQVTAPVVVISSVAQLGSPQAMRALDLGAVDVLPKPSGVLSMDLDAERGSELLDAIQRCTARLPARTPRASTIAGTAP